MRFRGGPALVVLATMGLVSCTHVIELRVKPELDASGKPIIDETYHHTAVVHPRDRIVWTCQCPPGTKFTVENVRFLGDLDEIIDRILPIGIEDSEDFERRIRALESVQRSLSVPEEWAPPSAAASDGRTRVQTTIADALELLEGLRSTLSPEEPRALFKKPFQPPDGFVDGTERIQSWRIAKRIGSGVWKFTWKVGMMGEDGVWREAEWDPHIVGHEKITY